MNYDLGRVSSEDEKRVFSRETRWQYELIFKIFNCPTREWANWVSEPVNGASVAKRSKAERCGASERSERCERTNVASDRVALSKRNRLRLEMPPKCTTASASVGQSIYLSVHMSAWMVCDKWDVCQYHSGILCAFCSCLFSLTATNSLLFHSNRKLSKK